MQIGNFGKLIVFETSDKKVLNPNNIKKEVSGNWGRYDRVGKKPRTVFLGPNLQSMNLEIILNAQLGVKPRTVIGNIENYIESGKVETLIIGGKKVFPNQCKILSMSETWDELLNGGELLQATLSLEFEEYL